MRKVVRHLFRSLMRGHTRKSSPVPSDDKQDTSNQDFQVKLFESLDKNLSNIKTMMDSPSDLVSKKVQLGSFNRQCGVMFIDGLTKTDYITEKILKNLQAFNELADESTANEPDQIVKALLSEVFPSPEVKKVTTLDDATLPLLSGETLIFIDGIKEAIIIDTRGWKTRALEQPITEAVVRGPRIAFTENIRTNTALIRRGIKDPNLRFKSMKVGRRSKADVVVAYINGIANPAMVKEVNRRLESIDMDDVQESGFVEQWIEDSFLSPFPQVQHTERPDRVKAELIQGRVAIIIDNTPFSLLVPVTFGQLFHSPEDYYERWHLASLIRVLRYVAAFVSVFLPGLYVALVAYHPGMIPTKLAFSIAGTREGVPFPSIIEALMMEGTMEILREAGLRLPQPIGQTIGVVGGLVIGEAAVSAGIVSPIMVIIVAVTAISSFALPSYSVAISLRIIRFAVMLAAAIFGLYGIILVYIMINVHFVNLKSFGVPYSTPFGPLIWKDWKDLVLRLPITMMGRRPQMVQAKDEDRSNNQRSKK